MSEYSADFEVWDSEMSEWLSDSRGHQLLRFSSDLSYIYGWEMRGETDRRQRYLSEAMTFEPGSFEFDISALRTGQNIKDWLNANPGKLPEDYPF